MSRAFAISALLLLGGCPTAYLQATGQFSQAARDGAGSLASAFDLSTQLCRDRADLAYLLPRLKAQYGAPSSFSAEPMRSRWFTDKTAGPGANVSWADRCGAPPPADNVHRTGLQFVIAYGFALQAVIGQGKFEGDDLRTVAGASAALAQKIGGGSANAYTGAIAGIGTPLTIMTDFLLAKIASNELRKKIGFADSSLQLILTKLLDYVNAAGELQLMDLTSSLGNVLDEVEYGLGAQSAPADPVRGVSYYQFAAYWEARLRFYRKAIDSTKKLINDLKAAHAALKHAGDGDGSVNDNDLRKVGGLVGAVVGEAAYFRALNAPAPGGP
jgi:hypothetical protein